MSPHVVHRPPVFAHPSRQHDSTGGGDTSPPRAKTKGQDSKPDTTRYDAIVAEANRLNSINTTYSQSSREGPTSFDCSSACAQLLRTAGYKVPFFTTITAPDSMVSGSDPTHRVTFWVSAPHMFAEITVDGNSRMWGTNTQNPGHAVSWHEHTTSGFTPYHVNGLDEAADIPANADLGGGGGGDLRDAEKIAKAAAFATFLELPGTFNSAESQALVGERSLMNDQALFPFIQQLAGASLRNFMSMPTGEFFAFYPDYFGGLNHRTPYWEIDDIEIINAQIELSDDALATHVYVVGDIAGYFDGVTIADKQQTGGIITIFNAFMADFLNGLPPGTDDPKNFKDGGVDTKEFKEFAATHPSLADKHRAIHFLKRYGARPYYQEAPMVRSPYYEAFLAYQQFQLMWARQFLTTVELTFMPELFPGGIVAFPDHGFQCYIDEVSHECDYESGFRTYANLSAPAALRDQHGKPIGDRPFIHSGMIRAFELSDLAPGGGKGTAKNPIHHGGG